MENDKIDKGVYVGKCVSSRVVGRSGKNCIDSVNECLKKRVLNIEQVRRTVYNRNEWWGFVRENAGGIAQGMNP